MAELKLNLSIHADDDGPVQRRQQAEHPDTSPEQLKMLMTDSHMSVRRQAMKHPKAPKDTLRLLQRLGASADLSAMQEGDSTLEVEAIDTLLSLGPWVKHLAARHRNTSQDQLEQIMNEADRSVRLQLAKHPHANDSLLLRLALDEDESVRDQACRHQAMTESILNRLVRLKLKQPFEHANEFDELASLNSEYVQIQLAKHPQLSTPHFENYLHSKNWKIREALLSNPCLTGKQLREVSKTLPIELWSPLVDHPNSPGDVLESLVESTDMGVKSALALHPNATETILKTLMEDGAFRVRAAVLGHPKCPMTHRDLLVQAGSTEDLISQQAPDMELSSETLHELSKGGPWAIQLVCAHPNTSEETLGQFVADGNFMIRESIARHPQRPQDLIDLMVKAGSSEDLQDLVSCKSELSTDEMEQLMRLGPWARRLLSRYTGVDAKFLQELVSDTDWQIRRTLARRKELPEAFLLLLAEDDSAEVRWSLLKNDAPPESVMQRLAMDELAQIRLSVASHPSVSQEILHRLHRDLDGDVRTVVEERLNNKTTSN